MIAIERKSEAITTGKFMIAEQIRETGNADLLSENIDLLASLPDPYLTDVHKGATECGLIMGKRRFDEMIASARLKAAAEKRGDGRPVIQVNNRSLDDSGGEAGRALEAINDPPILFRRNGDVVSIRHDELGRASIAREDVLSLRSRLARAAHFVTRGKRGTETLCSPPFDIVNDVLSAREGRFPALRVVTTLPVLAADGRVVSESGYDAETQTLYQPEPGFRLGPIPAHATQKEAAAAAHYLFDEVLGEFPYHTGADRANALGVLVTIVMRAGQRMKVPLIGLDSPKGGSGKTLLAKCYSVIMTGRDPSIANLPDTEAEIRKAITSLLEAGELIVVFDNVNRTIRSAALAAVLTSDDWTDRLLGRTERTTVPNLAVWIATANNLQVGAEIARRTCRIRLDPKTARPEKRVGFKRPDDALIQWLKRNRGAVVAAALTMVKAWIDSGRPKTDTPAFGSFNDWAQTIGGVLAFAGVEGFLQNIDELHTEADEESAEWEEFLTAWARQYGSDPISVSCLVDDRESLVARAIPEEVGPRVPAEPRVFAKRVGQALRRKAGTRFGDRELRIERCGTDSHSKTALWRVAGNLAGLAPEKTLGQLLRE